MANKYIAVSPADGLVMPAAEKGSHRAFTDDEVRWLKEVGDRNPHYLYTMFLLYTGIRPQEAIALRWSDFDANKKELHITKAIESSKKTLKTTKSKSGVRVLPIPDELLKLVSPKAPDALIFPNDKGEQADAQAFQRWWKATRRAINIYLGAKVYRNQLQENFLADDFTAYCCRHTYCTNLFRAKVPIYVAVRLMGHADTKMVMQIYGHDTADQLADARASINDFLSKQTKKSAENGD